MKPLAKFIGAALVGALALLAAPSAQAQGRVSINIGAPAWGPQVPYGTQYYYIPEIDGYYDLYAQQYIVFQDGYWVPLPELYGYDPYQFHPVAVGYRGNQPWLQSSYYHQRYVYQPYCNYGQGGYANGYYRNGYGRGRYPAGGYYGGGRGYNDRDDRGRNYGGSYGQRDHDDRDDDRDERGSYGNPPRGNPRGNPAPQLPQSPQPGGYSNGNGGGQAHGSYNQGASQSNNGNGNDQSAGRHGRD